nr:reversion-inducing cysteine-rich protein with Kazal motifs [Parasteatoda tepidariorum]
MPFIFLLLLEHFVTTCSRGTMVLTSSCCTLATGSCRATCEEISVVDLATNSDDRWRHITKLTSFCSEQLVPFWSCINETLTEIDKGQGFFGRPCCTLPQSQACIMVCLQAKDREELMSACRPSNEITFYSCLEKQEVGQQCCNKAIQSECAGACKELFSSTTEPSVQLRTYVTNTCLHDNPDVTKCVKNYTLITPAENPSRNLHCCDKSSSAECRLSCRNILRTQTIGQEIVDNLIDGGCGEPLPHVCVSFVLFILCFLCREKIMFRQAYHKQKRKIQLDTRVSNHFIEVENSKRIYFKIVLVILANELFRIIVWSSVCQIKHFSRIRLFSSKYFFF